jgi:hypothetical protein
MSLDAHPGDEALRAMHDRKTQAGPSAVVRNGVALGPESPLRAHRSGPKKDYTSRRPAAHEHEIQVALFAWVDSEDTMRAHPELGLFHAIPNGGHRAPAVAAKLKAEGVRSGPLDTHLPIARGGYHSLWIELKKPGGSLSPSQRDWLAGLTRHGNKVEIHTTWEGARDELLAYLALPEAP